jgi:hypothetical protein
LDEGGVMIEDGRVRMPSTAFSKRGPKIRGRQHDDKHLAYIRTLPCLVSGSRYCVEAAHIRYSDFKWGKINPGTGKKPDDKWVVPLSAARHRLDVDSQHNSDEREFWERHGIDPLPIARALWTVSGDYEAGMKIVLEAVKRNPLPHQQIATALE